MIQLNRRGITRDVLLVGRWAVKWPTFRYGLASVARGLLANRDERDWSECSDGIAPVRWSLGGIVNVYDRCAPVTEAEGIDPDTFDGPLGCPPPDRKLENLGRMPDGRVVWVDYDYSWNGCPTGHPLPEPDWEDRACESCGEPAEVQIADGSTWCRECDAACVRLGYDDPTRRESYRNWPLVVVDDPLATRGPDEVSGSSPGR